MPAQKFIDKFLIETALDNLWDAGAPPRRRIGSMVKPNATELPGIAKDEAAFGLLENEVIMFPGAKVRLLDPHVSGHAQMQAEKIVSRKFQQNLLSACNGTEEACASQLPNECRRIGFAKNPFLGVKFYSQWILSPIPGSHCRRIYSTSASSGMAQNTTGSKTTGNVPNRFPLLTHMLGSRVEKVIIVGSGCAGLTAAIYAARAN